MPDDGTDLISTNGASVAGPSLPPSIVVPEHELVRCIGSGSYGDVWLAKNALGTYRAVKIVYAARFSQRRPLERELEGIGKFEPISRKHPGLVSILQFGKNIAADCFYYVMELGDDRSGSQSIDPATYVPKTLSTDAAQSSRLPAAHCLSIALSLSDAVAFLHRQGLIHRDIKPSNIIFVQGVPKLADIGLVTEIGKDAPSMVGTQGFIPPEGPGTVEADIYSLGKVLYEICTGKDRQEFPALPAELSDLKDAEQLLELNEVILKACHTNPSKRYTSVEDMHSDLLLLSQGKSVRRLRTLERNFARLRNVAFVAVPLLLVLAGGYYRYAQVSKLRAELLNRQIGGYIADGTHALEGGDLQSALTPFVQALRLDQENPGGERNHRVRIKAVLSQMPKIVQMWSTSKPMVAAGLSPDGRSALVTDRFGSTRVFETATGTPLTPELGQYLERACFSPDGTKILTASGVNDATIWNLAGELLLKIPHSNRVYSAECSPDGRSIVTASDDPIARIFDASSGQLRLELKGHREKLWYASYDKEGKLIVTTSADSTARIWDASTGVELGPVLQHKSWVYHASFSPDNTRIVTTSFDRSARVWDVVTHQPILPPLLHNDGVRSANFSPDSHYLVTASLDSTVRLWDLLTGQPLSLNPVLRQSDRTIYASFHPDGHRVLTGSAEGVIRIWDLAGAIMLPFSEHNPTGSPHSGIMAAQTPLRGNMKTVPVSQAPVLDGAKNRPVWTANGNFVATFSAAPESSNLMLRCTVSTMFSGERISGPILVPSWFTNSVLNDDGGWIAAKQTNHIEIRDLKRGQLAWQVPCEPTIEKLFLNREGNRLVVTEPKVLKFYQLSPGRNPVLLAEHPQRAKYVAFSPDGRRFVSCTSVGEFAHSSAYLWDGRTGQALGPPLFHRDGVIYAQFSPDSQRLVTGSEDFTATVWEAATSRALTPPLPHPDQVHAASFSDDGRWVVTACVQQGSDGVVCVWDIATAKPLTPFLRHPAVIRQVKFLHNDSQLMARDRSGAVWLWELPLATRRTKELIDLTEILAGSHLFQTPPSPWDPSDLTNRWARIRSNYPEDFNTSPEQVLAWHRWEARQCEKNRLWSGAVFHLEKLAALAPENSSIQARLASNRELLNDLESSRKR